MSRVLGMALAALLVALGGSVAQAAPNSSGELLGRVAQEPGWGTWKRASIIEYRTEGPVGEAVSASGLLLLPDSPAPAGGYPVVAWDHPTMGLAGHCGITTSRGVQEQAFMQAVLDRGWAVVAPDYLGLTPGSTFPHPYLHTRTEATSTLDLVRAARAAEPALAPTWAVAGASQGGHAALATGSIAQQYAPELDFRGTAALAPESNFETLFAQMGPATPHFPMEDKLIGPFAGILAGLRLTRPDVDVNRILTPTGRALVDAISSSCVEDFDRLAAGITFATMLAAPVSEIGDALRAYMAAPTTFDQPLLITHGAADMVVPIPMTMAYLAQLRAAGTDYEFDLHTAGHREIEEVSRDAVLEFLGTLLGGS
ncbi:lipase family protein [Nocardia sp. NPDC058658]|uniref:lipase family protein n=1 Tax=Nocardia sp. NPDC058658 TaxID=3346580 RepID=UPI00364C7C7E